jgi:hypothetical protein
VGDSLGSKTQTSTNNYTSILKTEVPSQITKVLFHLKEQNVNVVKYKILASADDVTYETLKDETGLLKNGSVYEICEDPWRFFDVQIKSAVAGIHGNVKATVSGV